jgi:hypothetical protein
MMTTTLKTQERQQMKNNNNETKNVDIFFSVLTDNDRGLVQSTAIYHHDALVYWSLLLLKF